MGLDVYLYDAVRTPRGKGKRDGSLHQTRPIELLKTVFLGLKDRNNLDTKNVDDCMMGCVTPVGEQGGNICKAGLLYAGYAESVPGYTLNRFCSSGLDAINQGACSILGGVTDLVIAGGVESMSRNPIGSDGGAWSFDPDVAFTNTFVPQGISADLIATLKNYSRNDVDSFAVNSQKKAAMAQKEGRFKKSVLPVKDLNGKVLLAEDEYLRPGTTVEGLTQLKPSFQKMGENFGYDSMALRKYPHLERISHVHHAGNSSGIVDGAGAVLLGNAEAGKKIGLKPRAKIRSMAVVSTEPTVMLTGPMPATELALKKANLKLSDIDLFEVNEAFASVVLNFIETLKVPEEKINVNGGAIALGHPLGATGAMLMGTLLDELERANKNLGLVTLCVGGGMGVATIIERIS